MGDGEGETEREKEMERTGERWRERISTIIVEIYFK